MKFALIVCTYMRPGPLLRLMQSLVQQSLYPDQVLIIDGSRDDETQKALKNQPFPNLAYHRVADVDRGLTRQRNFGIGLVRGDMEIVCFLDDDIVLERDYFQQLVGTYNRFPDALGVGGYILGEASWTHTGPAYDPGTGEFYFDGWKRPDPSRMVLRKKLGLDSDLDPGYSPEFSHGRSIGFLPPSGKVYRVAQLMGGVSSFRMAVFGKFAFSTYFEGYGLYEDADFTLRVSATGPLYINTAATLHHYHDPSGRPNQYLYGKMVVRNGYYVWRVATPNPSAKARFKWHSITLLLALIRLSNVITGPNRMQALTESFGRFGGWISILVSPPGSRRQAI